MRKQHLSNLTLLALTASYFMQIGAGVFALAVIGRVVSAAPPRSLAILDGAYRYDSSAFWQVAPAVTGTLFLCALVANWQTARRRLLLAAFALFALGGVATVVLLAPRFAVLVAAGYRDIIDPALQRQAASWYVADWGVRGLDAVAGVLLLIAVSRPAVDPA